MSYTRRKPAQKASSKRTTFQTSGKLKKDTLTVSEVSSVRDLNSAENIYTLLRSYIRHKNYVAAGSLTTRGIALSQKEQNNNLKKKFEKQALSLAIKRGITREIRGWLVKFFYESGSPAYLKRLRQSFDNSADWRDYKQDMLEQLGSLKQSDARIKLVETID